ncbi:MAG: DNA polymerase III subunit alpha, partial [Gemmatimonadales bacterium]
MALGYSGLALTDHNGLYGAMEFAQSAKRAGVRPITGAELTLTDDRHVTLLVENATGYANLCRLITESHLGQEDRRDPKVAFPTLVERQEGLIILSGCRQGLFSGVHLRDLRQAERYRDLFPDRFYVELQRHFMRGDMARTRGLMAVADVTDLPVVATNDVHYHDRARWKLHDVLTALRHRTTLDGSHTVRRPNGEFYLKAPEAMARLFVDRPDAIANTEQIASRCTFDLTTDLSYEFPDFHNAPRALAELCATRLNERYPADHPLRAEAESRLQEELRLIRHHKLCGFFLVYNDLFDLAKEVAAFVRAGTRRVAGNLLPGRGRGSSVSSIVCYLMGLSHVDPIANKLFIGRFLNDSLASVPDIDLDFPREIREELIRRVYTRYGRDHVGLVCTFPTYRFRSAVRDVGKALDLPVGEIEQLAKMAHGFQSAKDVREEMARIPRLAEKVSAPIWEHLCDLCESIGRLPRHISQHVGGMIIASKPLLEIVPLELSAMPDRVLVQWDKDSCDDARFIKIDFLALGMLSLVEETVELIARREGTPPDLSRIDFHDNAVYDRICQGDTIGLFQIESRAQIQMIRRVRPRNLTDLAVQVAIVRPGPIVGGAVNPYVRRREAKRHAEARGVEYEPPVDHPLLKEALSETLGVIIYQDQVLQVCQSLASFTSGQAEGLRRAMSRRRSRELLESYWEQFRDGAAGNGVPEDTAKRVFEQVVAFSEFGFPKSHAAAFGLLAYQSAWLLHYYPLEFYVGLFNNQPMGFYSLDTLVREAKRNTIPVLLPDVNRSDVWCMPEDQSIRLGLGFIRNWSEETTTALIEERERHGAFAGLGDLIRRAPESINRDALERLVWVGACDSFGVSRRDLLWQIGLYLPPKRQSTKRVRRQLELGLDHPHANMRFDQVDASGRVLAEYGALGFTASGHPLDLLRGALPPHTLSTDLATLDHGSDVTILGLVVCRQRPQTAKGFVFLLIE